MSSPSPNTELRLQDPEEDPSELLKKLSAAIALGNASEASEVVAQLSNMHLKVDINLKSDVEQQTKDKEFSVRVHVEDRLADGCFINLQVRATDTIQDLKNMVMLKHNFPVQVQRWIIGKKLPGNGDRLSKCGVKGPGHTLYLYLVTARSAGLNSRQEYEEHRGAMLDGRAPVPQPYFQPASPHQLTRGQSSDSMWPRPPTPSDGQSRVYSNSGSPYESSTDLVGLSEIDQNGGGNFTGPSRQASKRSLSSGCSNLMEMLNSPNVSGNLPAMGGADNKRKSFSDSSASGWNEGSQREGGAIGGARSPTPPRTTPPRTPPPDKREHEEEGWACPACTYVNLPTRPGCEMCSSTRPADYKVPAGYQMTAREKHLLENDQRMERMTREAEEQEMLENYQNLLATEDLDLVANTEAFQCPICFDDIDIGEGIVLRECLHMFCRECLTDAVRHCEDAVLKCPFQDDTYSCGSVLLEREIKALVPIEIYMKFLQRGLDQAESQTANSYHCKTADCLGWCVYEDLVNFFTCPVCRKENCLTCKAIHEGQNCQQYQLNLKLLAANDAAARQTAEMLVKLVADGEAMHCPQCEVVVQKKGGCDWIKCSICKTEICWVTKGRRWGPNGEGDYSGGCGCRLQGKKCHPQCVNCH